MKLDISVIICVYKDYRIKRCLFSLMKQNYITQNYEILLIENGSNQKYKEFCEKYGIRYYCMKEKNIAKARSLGVRESKGKYILFTDADCVPDRNWIKEISSYLKENNIVGAGGKIKRYNPKTIAEIYGKNLAGGQETLQNYLPVINLPYVVFANAAFGRQALIDVNLFDSSLLSGEDVDICWKLSLKGYKLGICSSAIIYHENRNNAKSYFKAYFRYATYQVLLFEKYKKEIQAHKRRMNKWIILNTYPITLFISSSTKLIKEIYKKTTRRKSNIYTPYFGLIESIGIICGIIYGSIRFRKIPLY